MTTKTVFTFWTKLAAWQKAGLAALALLSGGWIARGTVAEQVSLPRRVAELEQRVRADSARNRALFDSVRNDVSKIRDQNDRIICYLEEQFTPKGRSCL